jgi:ParB-like chromosome segregation protein Spo0J
MDGREVKMSKTEMSKTVSVEKIVVRDDLYPRIKHDPSIVQKYAEDIEVLPPIEVNQDYELIDGKHRLLAHKLQERKEIEVVITETKSDNELLALACKRNSSFGLQLNEKDKRSMAIKLYNAGEGIDKKEIASLLSVTERSVSGYLKEIDGQIKEARKDKIMAMWLACYTQEEIAEAVGQSQQAIAKELELLPQTESLPKVVQLAISHSDDFEPPLYNIWSFSKKSNKVSHFGNSEITIVDNLLYLYTEPFDIVLDPFAGGGSTIDICQKRMRRYWASDRKPTVAREDIRLLDIVEELPPFAKRWSEVKLTYLDPPYWKQAEGQYSKDKEDLANMSQDDFRKTLTKIVKSIAAKQTHGVIALLIQPTQWKADNKEVVDHVADLLSDIKLPLEMRISCPYSTEQYNAQQVEWAKKNKKLLVLTRELLVWRCE